MSTSYPVKIVSEYTIRIAAPAGLTLTSDVTPVAAECDITSDVTPPPSSSTSATHNKFNVLPRSTLLSNTAHFLLTKLSGANSSLATRVFTSTSSDYTTATYGITHLPTTKCFHEIIFFTKSFFR